MSNIKISAYTTTRNAQNMGYPFIESISSMMSFADEVVVFDNHSTDDTISLIKSINDPLSKIMVYSEEENIDISDKRFAAKFDGGQKAKSRAKCTGDVLFQFDCDEVVSDLDSENIINCCHYAYETKGKRIFCTPLVEFWGSKGKIRCDLPFYKQRISINDKNITHGIPAKSIATDDNGDVYSKYSDSCDYIFADTKEPVPYDLTFINRLFEQSRHSYFIGEMDKNTFVHMAESFFIKAFPVKAPLVYHYSWFNIELKIINYKNYWGKFWSSMFDEKTGEQNYFFGKPWSEVSDAEISYMAEKIEGQASGWVFHKAIDFSVASKYPFVRCNDMDIVHPEIMKNWIKNNG